MSFTPIDSEPAGIPIPVNYDKVDAALAGALEDTSDCEARTLLVFVHLGASAPSRRTLAGLGITGATGRKEGIATSTLSPREVAELSQRAWVRQLRLSGRSRLKGQ